MQHIIYSMKWFSTKNFKQISINWKSPKIQEQIEIIMKIKRVK